MTIEEITFELSEEQKRFCEAALSLYNKRNVLLLGKAGVGKSTAVWALRKQLDDAGIHYVCLAPTGVAAINIGGQTIHRYISELSNSFRRPQKPDLLLIDEVSMLRADLCDRLNTNLQSAFMDNAPFAGIKTIFIGDPGQLPPVVKKDDGESKALAVNYHSPYFWSAYSYSRCEWEVIELTTIFRQGSDKRFVNLLNMLRAGHTDTSVAYLNKFRTTSQAKGVILVSTNKAAQERNERELRLLPGWSETYHAEISGEVDRKEYPTEENLQLKIGARVMVVKNIYRGEKENRYLELVNGDVGTVTDLNESFVTIRCDRTGEEHEVTYSDGIWSKDKSIYNEKEKRCYTEQVGSFTQIPLRLAWAITIHKSQGATLHELTLDLSRSKLFERGQAYVALSRGTALERTWIMGRITAPEVQVCPEVAAFLNDPEHKAGVGIKKGSIFDGEQLDLITKNEEDDMEEETKLAEETAKALEEGVDSEGGGLVPELTEEEIKARESAGCPVLELRIEDEQAAAEAEDREIVEGLAELAKEDPFFASDK